MDSFVHEMLHDSTAAQHIHALWHEYEVQESPEARFVKGTAFPPVRLMLISIKTWIGSRWRHKV